MTIQTLELLRWHKSVSQDEAMFNSEEIKPIALANIDLKALVSQSVNYSVWEKNSVTNFKDFTSPWVYGWSEDILNLLPRCHKVNVKLVLGWYFGATLMIPIYSTTTLLYDLWYNIKLPCCNNNSIFSAALIKSILLMASISCSHVHVELSLVSNHLTNIFLQQLSTSCLLFSSIISNDFSCSRSSNSSPRLYQLVATNGNT